MNKSYRSPPLRYQIRERLIAFILDRGYQPGDQLPAEGEWGDLLGVSRFSLREALLLLEEERVISTRHGSGRYLVAVPNAYQIDITRLQSVTELMASYGLEVTKCLLRIIESASLGEVAANLGIEIGTPMLSVERLRYAKNTPIIYSIDYLEKNRLSESWTEEGLRGSLFDYLEQQAGIVLDNSQATIRSTLLPPDLDELMGRPHISWILLEQVIFDRKGEAIIFSKDYHRGDYILFNVLRYRR